jgi:hypothetical protein
VRGAEIAVSVMTFYELDGWGSVSSRCKKFLFHSLETSSGAQPVSYPMGTGASLPEGKVAGGHVGEHSSPSSAKVKNSGAIPVVLHMSSQHSASSIKHRGNFAFLPCRLYITVLNCMMIWNEELKKEVNGCTSSIYVKALMKSKKNLGQY